MRTKTKRNPAKALTLTIAVALMAATTLAFTPKEAQDELDLLVFIDPQLRLVEVNADASGHTESSPAFQAMNAFRATHGETWKFTVDLRRGVPTLLGGGAMALIPGAANELDWEQFAPGCSQNQCIPVATVEALGRDFMNRNSDIFGLASADLVLDPAGSGPFGDSMYFLHFQWQVGGVPVENGSVYFRINRGNLIQVATQAIGPTDIDLNPSLSSANAKTVVEDYLGPFGGAGDILVDEGSLLIVPVTPRNQDTETFTGSIGTGIDYRLTYRFAFERKDVIGTWEALVDAHTGELIRFVDTNRYGRVHGGAYPGDNHTGEADRPFPFADTGLPAPDNYADGGGLFPGDNATTQLRGKYARINDSCGSINNNTTTGDVDFSLGAGTNCDVPPGNTGGSGNTHSARTQYYHLTVANLRAQAWMPSNTWLTSSYITVNTNQSPWCNATSGGDTLNFYRASSGCWNLGEIPGVALHEWGHSLDNFDGSGGQSQPVETYADWMAALHLHDSCVGRGFFLSGNCGGYGDACTNCSGIRDMDYTQHQANTPWTAANFGSVWSCGGGGYNGPCGVSDHCESGISSQALWDFATRKLTAPPYSMDQNSAWILGDRLWYLVIPTLGSSMYTCSFPNSNGCGGSSLYNVMLAIDDDGDGTANGTPHAGAIFSAMNDHNIACGNAGDPQNQDQTSCPSIGAPTVSAEPLNNEAEISWTSVTNATAYHVYRSDISCDSSMTRVGEVDAPGISFIDTTVVNDIEYYYMVQAVAGSDGCVGPLSNCVTVMPIPCTVPDVPFGLSATAAGVNQITLGWTSPGPDADTYNVYRSIGTCPQADYQLIASGIGGTSYMDMTVSGGIDYSYVVSSVDITGGCESAFSGCDDAQTTGACIEAPAFDGIQTATNPGANTCTLDLGWNAASPYCGGPVNYNVYRSTTSGFTPAPANRIATGVTGTTYADDIEIEYGTNYFYVVRSVDQSNGSEDSNLVELVNSPTGPIGIGTWVDDAGDTGSAQLDPTSPWSIHASGGNTGPKVYATGDYGDDTCAGVTTPELHLGAGPQLSFWSRYDIESGWDKGEVQISTNGGTSWTRLPVNYPGTVNNDNDECDLGTGTFFNGTDTSYDEYTVSLATWANQDVMLRWLMSSDGSVTESGWWVDDLSITDVEVPSECTSGVNPLPGSFGKTLPAHGATGQPLDVTLSWAASTGAAGYEYCIDTVDNGACDSSWTAVGNNLNVNPAGLLEWYLYSWQVRAVNGDGSTEADGTVWWNFITTPLLLEAGMDSGTLSDWTGTVQ